MSAETISPVLLRVTDMSANLPEAPVFTRVSTCSVV